MKTYVWLSFAFMGWGYYELSGGADFNPEQSREVAAAETASVVEENTQNTEVVVTRAATPSLLAVSSSNASSSEISPTTPANAAEILPAAVEETAIEVIAASATVPFATEEVTNDEPRPFTAEPPLDIRQVAGSRVNMRSGPSTDFGVITTLDGGTGLEVLEVNADGWARVTVTESGTEGWMAERLLTEPQG